MKIGYCRVSTAEQNTGRQVQILKDAGCEQIYTDYCSGVMERPELNKMLSFVRKGDTVFVESFSRLARSTFDLLAIVNAIIGKDAEITSIKENFDTTTANGRFILHVFAALSELERETLKQRSLEGIEVAKKIDADRVAQGMKPIKYKGRARKKVDFNRFKVEYNKWVQGEQTATQAMRALDLKKNTFYRRVQEYEETGKIEQ